jgi:hypothetical protein
MRKIIATGALLVTLAALTPTPAQAGAATNVALGLASFAVFNQVFGGFHAGRVWAAPYYPGYYGPYYAGYPYPAYYPPVAYAPPAVTYSQAPVAAYAPPAPPVQNEVVYPHGKYVLTGNGVTVAYQWVWVPNPPSAPPQQ